MNSKQRQLRKSGNELAENDAAELLRITTEQAILQKHLDASRKQTKQHRTLCQDYRSKQQQRQPQPQTSEPCSPLMSPSQHSSPLHSPAALVSHSPGPGSVPSNMIQHSPATSMIQHSPNPPLLQHSPGNPQASNPGTMSPHNMQSSPRIGTPHSQGEESPFSPGAMPSPGICTPTSTRMASPQHRSVITGRMATNPGNFTSDGRTAQQMMGEQGVRLHTLPQRFVRPPAIGDNGQRPRMQLQGGIVYGQRSPLESPQPVQQPMMTQQQHQQMLQRQQMIQQQHEVGGISHQETQNIINQRTLQMVQQRHQLLQQQQQQQQLVQQRQQFMQMQQQHMMQKPPTSPMVSQPANSPSPQMHQQIQQNYGPPPSSPMPRSPMVQQTIGSPMLQQQLSQNSQPPSPMNNRIHSHPPSSPMMAQYQPPSPMSRNHPPTSPMLQHQLNNSHHPQPPQTPNSPMPRSPMVGGSPMQMQRRQSSGNSPAMPDRPQSVENPGTPRTPHTPHTPHTPYSSQNSGGNDQQQQDQSILSTDHGNNRGGGNPHNPLNPLPLPSSFGRYGYFKLGLRGGSPMWSIKPESSKGKTAESHLPCPDEKPNTSAAVHRKTGIPQSKINSLVCADYNDFDDDSHTPPQTPPTDVEPKPTSSLADTNPLPLGSPSDKLEPVPDTTDYDDDKTIVNTEVTLSSTAQRDSDDITVIEQFGDTELGDVITGTLEPDMQEEYVLFESDMVVDLSVDSNDSLSHALVNDGSQSHNLVEILEIEHSENRGDETVLSDEDLITSQNRNKKGLRLDIVRTLQSGNNLVAVTDTPESPDQEELNVDPSPGPYTDQSPDHMMVSLVEESEVVIIDPSSKSPEDSVTKEFCNDETDKVETNDLSETVAESNTSQLLKNIDSKPEQKESNTQNSPSFQFPNKTVRCEMPPSSLHQANIGVSGITKPAVSYPSISANTPVSTAVETRTTAADTDPDTIEVQSSVNDLKDIITTSTLEVPKQIMSPSAMASIVADAKIAARLCQAAAEVTMSSDTSSVVSKQQNAVESTTTTAVDGEYLQLLQVSKIKQQTLPAKLAVSVQPTSVTLSTPKMSIPDLPTKENANGLSNDVIDEVDGKAESTDVQTHSANHMGGETSTEEIDNSSHPRNEAKDTSRTDDKKSDSLNTTDELESMLEAIHNPEDNITGNVDRLKTHGKPAEAGSMKRMSPVADNLSLVNILENDVELSGAPANKNKGKVPAASQGKPEVELAQVTPCTNPGSSPGTTNNSSADQNSANANVIDSNKDYMPNLNVEKNLMDESSDEILDMLHNIISSKPEMANTDILQQNRSSKPSLIYPLPAPLDTLPLNILQDSLLDLEQEKGEIESLSQKEGESPKSQKATTPPTDTALKTSSPMSHRVSTPISLSAVTQLQKSTTTIPHLSPLSKPTELSSNVATVSHQLRTLLSSLQSNHSQGYTMSDQASAPVISSVTAAAKFGSMVIPTSSISTNVQMVSSTDVSYRLQTPNTTSTNANIKVDGESSSSNPIAELKSNQHATVSVISTICKPSSSEQYSRTNSSPLQTQTTSAGLQTASMVSRAGSNPSVSITSNAMLNSMLAGTNSAKPSTASHRASGAVSLTQTSNLLSSVPASCAQRTATQNLQAILQVSTNATSNPSRVVVSSTTNATSAPIQCLRTIVPPVITTGPMSINVTTSILQSTLSQAPTLLHTQLTSGQTLYNKPTSHLPIDNKSSKLEGLIQNATSKKDSEDTSARMQTNTEKTVSANRLEMQTNKIGGNPSRMEESQNVLLKQLLQNTACATTISSSGASQGPSLPLVPSLEAQLARPVPPTPSSLLPPLLNETTLNKPTPKQILNRETSFVSHPATSLKTPPSPPKEEQSTVPTPAPQCSTSGSQQQPTQRMTDCVSKLQPMDQQTMLNVTMNSGVQQGTTTSTVKLAPSTQPTSTEAIVSSSQNCAPIVSKSPNKTILDSTSTNTTQTIQQPVSTSLITTKVIPPSKPSTVTAPSKQAPAVQQVGGAGQPAMQSTLIPLSQPQLSQSYSQPLIPQSVSHITQKFPHVNVIQPSVPVPVSYEMGRPAQLSQGALTQHTVPLVEVKKEILDEVLSGGTPTHVSDTKDFLLTAKEEFIDGPMNDKIGE